MKPTPILSHIDDLETHGQASTRRSTGEFLGLVHSLPGVEVSGTLHIWFQSLKPGVRSSPPHTHSHTTEGFVVLRGRVEASSAHDTHTLREGSVLVLPPGTDPHEIVGQGSEEALLVGFAVRNPNDKTTFAPETHTPEPL